MEGELCKEIKVEDSTWTIRVYRYTYTFYSSIDSNDLEDNKIVLVHLEKLNQQQWWENVLTHHPKIDTRKIEPKDSKLSDLDGEMRYAWILCPIINQRVGFFVQRNSWKDDGMDFSFLSNSHIQLFVASLITNKRYTSDCCSYLSALRLFP